MNRTSRLACACVVVAGVGACGSDSGSSATRVTVSAAALPTASVVDAAGPAGSPSTTDPEATSPAATGPAVTEPRVTGSEVIGPAAPGPSAAAGNGAICGLLDPDEVAAVLGGATLGSPRPISTPEVAGQAATDVCFYPTEPAAGQVEILRSTVADPAAFVPDQNALDEGATPLPGLGDDAFVIEGGFPMLFIRQGSITLLIALYLPPGVTAGREQLVQLGTTALSRL